MIKTDSRKIIPGDTFIAIKGIDTDGHNYIEDAITNGATKIIATKGTYSVDTLIVDDTQAYLNKYLYDNYKNIISKLKIIGITGTNGKTTTSFLIYEALNKLGFKTAYIGTVGFYINGKIRDLPNTTCEILEMYNMLIEAYEQGCTCVSLEVSSQGIDMKRLEGITYDYAIFSNLTQDHLDYHKTMENYALAKQKLFKRLKPNGIAIVNTDDPYSNYFLLDNNNITYGFNKADYQITKYEMNHIDTKFTYTYHNKEYNIVSPLLGKYNVYNMLCTIIILRQFNVSDIALTVSNLKAPLGRMETIKYQTNSIIIDYAHTPDAIYNIITTVKEVTKGNIYVVFGCTGDRDRTKRPIMTKLVTDLVKKAIITNDDPHYEDSKQIVSDMTKGLTNTNYEIIIDRHEAILKGISLLDTNDVLLILGKGHEEAMVIKDKKVPFNDKNEVLNYLENNETINL
ncbi:MAG: UDP-N-acetylmuramoyl-L-alanyl-D-glutamate--2,6-diaminopimelate ligase [Bacilli bacterium]